MSTRYEAVFINPQHQHYFQQYDFDAWTYEQRLTFLQQAIELRAKLLLGKMEDRAPRAVSNTYAYLQKAYAMQDAIEFIKADPGMSQVDKEKRLAILEDVYFGELSHTPFGDSVFYPNTYRAKRGTQRP